MEDHPLGTAGALFKMPQLTEDFLLLCGDVNIDVDFNRFIAFHKEHKAWASLVAHPNGHPYDSSLLVTEVDAPKTVGGMPEDTHRVIRWMAKEDERTYYKNRVNAGIELISPELLKETMKNFMPRHPETPDKIDLDRDVLKPNISSGRIFAYDTPEYIKDMGTPDRLYETERDIEIGKVHARNLKNKQKAIFLDRDGTINKMVGFVTKPEQFELIDGAAEAIKAINKSSYLAIVVTNQPVIARGDCTFEELQTIHDKMETELGKAGAFVDAIYVCPHHTDKGFEGERPEYKSNCDCRKPKPGLLLQAAKDFNINLRESYMIGDSHRDVEAGENAGVKKSIKVEENKENGLLGCIKEVLGTRMNNVAIINNECFRDTDIPLAKLLAERYIVDYYIILDSDTKISKDEIVVYVGDTANVNVHFINGKYRRRDFRYFLLMVDVFKEIKKMPQNVF